MNPPRSERLSEFIHRLTAAPAASRFEDAYELVCNTLNDVENELTTIPFDPSKWQTDGRMYPPQMDNSRTVQGREDVKRFRTRHHNLFIADNGAIQILDLRGKIVFTKNGADGKGI